MRYGGVYVMRCWLLVLLCGGLGVGVAQGQGVDRLLNATAGSYFYHADPGDVTIVVNVWGATSNPGLYEVTQGTHFSELLSLAGGPLGTARDENVDFSILLKLYRYRGGEPVAVYSVEMRNEIAALESDPLLESGDIVVLEAVSKRRFSWRDTVPFISAASSVLLLLDRFINN